MNPEVEVPTMDEAERIELRDGREFKVTVVPERQRRTRRKPIRTRKDVRAQMIAEGAGLGLDLGLAAPHTPER